MSLFHIWQFKILLLKNDIWWVTFSFSVFLCVIFLDIFLMMILYYDKYHKIYIEIWWVICYFNRLVPAKLMRDWTALFISGKPLYEQAPPPESTEPSPEQILEEERQALLDEGDFSEYKVGVLWRSILIGSAIKLMKISLQMYFKQIFTKWCNN